MLLTHAKQQTAVIFGFQDRVFEMYTPQAKVKTQRGYKKAHGPLKPDLMSPSRGSLWGRVIGVGVDWISDICLL